jgi:hypothetical protein
LGSGRIEPAETDRKVETKPATLTKIHPHEIFPDTGVAVLQKDFFQARAVLAEPLPP